MRGKKKKFRGRSSGGMGEEKNENSWCECMASIIGENNQAEENLTRDLVTFRYRGGVPGGDRIEHESWEKKNQENEEGAHASRE